MKNISTQTEKPQNGIKGLKHWRYDLGAGLQVALVSLPLSLGIAIASGAPPITGVISAIIAGLIFPFLGGAYVTISGPAAGLAPALLSGMLMLGGGDLAAGYPLLLVAICLTGLAQIVLSLFNAGRFALFLPVTVVEGMLAAIGTIIIIKQIPALLGVFAPPAKSMLVTIENLPGVILKADPGIAAIGGICLVLLFYLNRTRHAWMRSVPPPLFVAVVGIGLGYLLQVDPKYLITMPHNIIEGGITLPAFGEVWDRPDLWWSILLVVVTLTLIDGIESLATVAAVDKIDPYQRKSHPNVTLRAMGVSNTMSSIFGGLTIIPGGIKSRANVDAGGRTLWANFYNAVFLIVFLLLADDLIARIPLAAIGAILVYVGWRLCEFNIFHKTFTIGRDQMVIFVATIAAILVTDLLFGILLGIAAEIWMLVYLLTPTLRMTLTGRLTFTQWLRLMRSHAAELFRNPVIKVRVVEEAGRPHYYVSLGSIVCFNLLPLDKLLQSIPPDAAITLVITESGHVIDHTAMEYLHQFQDGCLDAGRPFEMQGLNHFYQFTSHALSARMRDAKLIKGKKRLSVREQQMAELAQRHGFAFAPATVPTLNINNLIYLRRGDNRQECNVISGIHHGCQVKLFDYSHTAAPDYYTEHQHTIIQLRRLNQGELPLPNLVITPGNYLEHYLVEYEEVDLTNRSALAQHYRLYAQNPAHALALIGDEIGQLILDYPRCYIEIRNNTLLIFRPDRDLEPVEEIEPLLAFAQSLHDHACPYKL